MIALTVVVLLVAVVLWACLDMGARHGKDQW